jgi:hypothetical protein
MKIFLSGVSSQFKVCRDALRSDLSAVGAKVVVQEDFQQHGASLLEKLERYIASCDRVIALVGDAYGFEPEEPARPLGRPRRSYTQWEYFFAMGERLDGSRQPPEDTFLYLGSPEFLAMHPVSQSDDAAQLQQEFIKEPVRSGKDRNRFSVLHELCRLVLRYGFQLRTRAPQPRNLPYTSIGRLFKGREHILADLHERLGQNPERALVVYGQAGVGKTRLTIEYALRQEAQYTALLSVGAESGEALQRNLAALCGPRVLDLAEREAKEQELQVAAVQRWLSEHSGWLLILDNAESIAVTWDTSFEQLSRTARYLLNLLCWLAPDPVPRALIACAKLAKQNAGHETPAEDGDVEEALAELASFSMLRWDTGNQVFRIHRLVRDVIRERQPDGTLEAAEALEELLPRLRGGHVIITSRLSDWSGSVETVDLELLSEDAAVEFLL